MNKNNISKLKLFFMGLESRFSENNSIFNHITVNYVSGLKNFKGIAQLNEDSTLQYNFKGITKTLTINELFEHIVNEAESYESLSLTYSERC